MLKLQYCVLLALLARWAAAQSSPPPPRPVTEFTTIPDDTEHYTFCVPYNMMMLPANETHPPGLWSSLSASAGGPFVSIDSFSKAVYVSVVAGGNTTSKKAVRIIIFIPIRPRIYINQLSNSAC